MLERTLEQSGQFRREYEMASSKALVLGIVCVLGLAVLATAANNKYGVADVHRVNFSNSIRIGDAQLPPGEYEIKHVMEAENHIMVFHRIGGGKTVDVRAKCTLVPLPQKASQTQKSYVRNAADQPVLRELVFAGETAKHVF
jgi:hypothetical protein